MTLENPHSSDLNETSNPHLVDNTALAKNPSPKRVITDGCSANSIAEVLRGIQAGTFNDPGQEQELISWAVHRAVYRGRTDILRYLLEQKGAKLDSLYPLLVTVSPSIELFQLLFDHGWDINQRPQNSTGHGQSLLQLICYDESLVHWCLDHGASVEDPHPDPYECPPLLELVAGSGTVDIFRLLQSRGAHLGRQALHRAARSAAAASSGNDELLAVRMAMVKYLVDDLGLDVNAMDCEGQMPNHWGTPLCYAALFHKGGEEVVQFLLDRGADPSIKDCWGIHDALGQAEFKGNAQLSELFRAWMAQKDRKG